MSGRLSRQEAALVARLGHTGQAVVRDGADRYHLVRAVRGGWRVQSSPASAEAALDAARQILEARTRRGWRWLLWLDLAGAVVIVLLLAGSLVGTLGEATGPPARLSFTAFVPPPP
jgi:hypothetical protein